MRNQTHVSSSSHVFVARRPLGYDILYGPICSRIKGARLKLFNVRVLLRLTFFGPQRPFDT